MGKRQSPLAITLAEHHDLALPDAAFRSKLEYEFFNNFQSEHTRKSYRNDVNQFLQFIADHFPEISSLCRVERVHVVAYRNWLSDNDMAPKTINRKISSISSYYDFLIEKNLCSYNPTTSVKRPRQQVVSPTNDLSDQQIEELLRQLWGPGPSAPLHRAIIYVLFSTGIRKSELINLRLKDYKKIGDHHVVEVRAKGGKYLEKVLHPTCAEVLDQYLAWMNDQGRMVEKEDWIFQPTRNPLDPGHLVRPLGPKSIDYIIKNYTRKAGITCRISPHSARASYIGSALENGQDLLRVSQDVGHASVRTTQEYNKRRQKISESPAHHLAYFKKTS